MVNNHGIEKKEMSFIFGISYAIFFLIFFGLHYMNCYYPAVKAQPSLSLWSSVLLGLLFFSLLSYICAVISCALYTDFKLKT